MPVCVALLRGINVGGRNMIAMSDLREFVVDLGFGGVKSLLQSGNLVFQSEQRTTAALERLLETETQKWFKLSVDYVVRTAKEWETIVADNPFVDEAASDPSHLVVMCLKQAAEQMDVKALQAAIKGPETVRSIGKQLYAVYPAGIGTSKLTNAVIEQKLGSRCTGRNWNTVLKIAALTRD
jgi:uncharacterized protein (DUF1697 family)